MCVNDRAKSPTRAGRFRPPASAIAKEPLACRSSPPSRRPTRRLTSRRRPRPSPFSTRFEAVDLLRGAIMVLMVIDHTRDFFGDVSIDPTDLAQVESGAVPDAMGDALLRTGFAFLAGMGAYLAGIRGRSRGGLAAFLASRRPLAHLPRADGREPRRPVQPRIEDAVPAGVLVDRGLVRPAGPAGLPAESRGRGARRAPDRDASDPRSMGAAARWASCCSSGGRSRCRGA